MKTLGIACMALVVGLLVMPGGARTAESQDQSEVRSPWTAWRGGFHAIDDLAIAPDGQPWGAGTGIVSGEGGRWRVTDWGPGRRFLAIVMDGPASGWALANPDSEQGNLGPDLRQTEIVRIEDGRIAESIPTPGVWWADLAMASPTDVWAVGVAWADPKKPVFRHFNGQAWVDHTPEVGTLPFDRATIVAVDLLRADLAYAISDDGTLWRWDGTAWKIWQQLSSHYWWIDIDALPEGDIWAVGRAKDVENGNVIAHFDGHAWRTWSGDGGTLHAIAMAGPKLGWALGDYGLIRVYDGEDWRRLYAISPSYPFSRLSSIVVVPGQQRALAAANAEGHVYLLGPDNYEFVHGGNWHGRFLGAISSDGAGGAWIGGSTCAPANCWATPPMTMTRQVPVIRRWDGRVTEREEQVPNLEGGIRGLSLRRLGDVWAVGGIHADLAPRRRASGFVLRNDGSGWRQVGGPTEVSLEAVEHGLDGSGWAIGNRGFTDRFEEPQVLELSDSGWQVRDRLGPGVRLLALSVISSDDVWVGGEGFEFRGADEPDRRFPVLRHFDGMRWRDVPIQAESVTALSVSPSGQGWAGAWADLKWTLFERVGEDWLPRQQLLAPVRSLRLVTDDEGYAGTGQGQIFRLAGGKWTADWSEADRFTSLLNIRDLALLGWQRGAAVIGAVGDAETVMVRWPEGPSGPHFGPWRYGVFLPMVDLWRRSPARQGSAH